MFYSSTTFWKIEENQLYTVSFASLFGQKSPLQILRDTSYIVLQLIGYHNYLCMLSEVACWTATNNEIDGYKKVKIVMVELTVYDQQRQL